MIDTINSLISYFNIVQGSTDESVSITEVLVTSHQHKVTTALNDQMADDANEEMGISQNSSVEIAGNVNSLMEEILDVMSSEGVLEAVARERLLLDHSEQYTALVRDYKSFKEDQVRKVKHLMDKKMKDRRQRQHTRQLSKKAEVCDLVVNKSMMISLSMPTEVNLNTN